MTARDRDEPPACGGRRDSPARASQRASRGPEERQTAPATLLPRSGARFRRGSRSGPPGAVDGIVLASGDPAGCGADGLLRSDFEVRSTAGALSAWALAVDGSASRPASAYTAGALARDSARRTSRSGLAVASRRPVAPGAGSAAAGRRASLRRVRVTRCTGVAGGRGSGAGKGAGLAPGSASALVSTRGLAGSALVRGATIDGESTSAPVEVEPLAGVVAGSVRDGFRRPARMPSSRAQATAACDETVSRAASARSRAAGARSAGRARGTSLRSTRATGAVTEGPGDDSRTVGLAACVGASSSGRGCGDSSTAAVEGSVVEGATSGIAGRWLGAANGRGCTQLRFQPALPLLQRRTALATPFAAG